MSTESRSQTSAARKVDTHPRRVNIPKLDAADEARFAELTIKQRKERYEELTAREEDFVFDETPAKPRPPINDAYDLLYAVIVEEDGLPLAMFVTHIIRRSRNQRAAYGDGAAIWDTAENFGKRLGYSARQIGRLSLLAVKKGWLIRVKDPYAMKFRLTRKSVELERWYMTTKDRNPHYVHHGLAGQVGANAAMIYGAIRRFTLKQIKHKEEFLERHHGWTEPVTMTGFVISALQTAFPWMSANEIRLCLSRLRRFGLIVYGPKPKYFRGPAVSHIATTQFLFMTLEEVVAKLIEIKALKTPKTGSIENVRPAHKMSDLGSPNKSTKCPTTAQNVRPIQLPIGGTTNPEKTPRNFQRLRPATGGGSTPDGVCTTARSATSVPEFLEADQEVAVPI